MPARLIWTEQAREDLIEIYLLIAEEHPIAAERYLQRIENLIILLRDQPRMGALRNDLVVGLRALVERPYVVFYRLLPDEAEETVDIIEVVRVVDGRRDLPSLF